jgi:hypothetical protein
MRWNSHPGRALIIVALTLMMIPGIAAAQSTPEASPAATQAQPQAVWEQLEGVDHAVMRTWGDVPEGTPVPGEVPTLRFVTGLVAQFDGPTHAAAAVEPVRDWMLGSLQVNLVGVKVTPTEVEVTDLGDSAAAVTATGNVGQTPLSIAVIVVQKGDRVLAVGGSVTADQDLLPLSRGILETMLGREPSGEEKVDNVGRFSGGLWEMFPPSGDASLDGMRGQGDLPIFQKQAS